MGVLDFDAALASKFYKWLERAENAGKLKARVEELLQPEVAGVPGLEARVRYLADREMRGEFLKSYMDPNNYEWDEEEKAEWEEKEREFNRNYEAMILQNKDKVAKGSWLVRLSRLFGYKE